MIAQTERMVKTSFTVPEKLSHEIKERVIKDGYGMKGKSKWIREAIEDFFMLKNYLEYIVISDDFEKLNTIETIIIPTSIIEQVEQVVFETRKQHPMMEGVRSKILRAAVLQRLIRGAG